MATDRFDGVHRIEDRLAFFVVGNALARLRRHEAAIVFGVVHVAQAAGVEHGDVARFALVAGEYRPEAALAVAAEDFREQRSADPGRMAALAAKGRIDDRRAALARARRQPRERRGAHQRRVDRPQQAAFRRGRQRGDPGAHARNHAAIEIGIAHADDVDALERRSHGFRAVAIDDMDVPHARFAQARRDMADDRAFAEGKQRLQRAHARRPPGGQHDRGDFACGIGVSAALHQRVHSRLFAGRFVDVDFVLGEDLLGLRPDLENQRRAALVLQRGIEIDDVGAVYAAVFRRRLAFEPARELFQHDVEERVHLLVFRAAAGIEPEHAAAAAERAAIEALAHAHREPGHGANQIGIVAALRFERQLHQHVAAGEALQQQFGDAERFVIHGALP